MTRRRSGAVSHRSWYGIRPGWRANPAVLCMAAIAGGPCVTAESPRKSSGRHGVRRGRGHPAVSHRPGRAAASRSRWRAISGGSGRQILHPIGQELRPGGEQPPRRNASRTLSHGGRSARRSRRIADHAAAQSWGEPSQRRHQRRVERHRRDRACVAGKHLRRCARRAAHRPRQTAFQLDQQRGAPGDQIAQFRRASACGRRSP